MYPTKLNPGPRIISSALPCLSLIKKNCVCIKKFVHFLIGFMFASDAIDKFLVSVSTKIMIINREIGSGPRWERSVFFRISMVSYINYVNTFGGPKSPPPM